MGTDATPMITNTHNGLTQSIKHTNNANQCPKHQGHETSLPMKPFFSNNQPRIGRNNDVLLMFMETTATPSDTKNNVSQSICYPLRSNNKARVISSSYLLLRVGVIPSSSTKGLYPPPPLEIGAIDGDTETDNGNRGITTP